LIPRKKGGVDMDDGEDMWAWAHEQELEHRYLIEETNNDISESRAEKSET
jgi:hypothetical protein